jgi:heat shock protein HslJ
MRPLSLAGIWAQARTLRFVACLLGAGFCSVSAGALFLELATPASAQIGPGRKLPRKPQDEKVPTGPSGPVEQQFPFGATWILVDIDGKPVSGDAPSFNLDDKLRATGFGGCNTFSMALYPVRDQKLAAGAIAVTKKTCGKSVDDAEHTVLVGLHSLPTWHLEPNGDLNVKSQVGLMHFKRGL